MVFRRSWGAALVWRGGRRGCRTAGVWRGPPAAANGRKRWNGGRGGRLCRGGQRHPGLYAHAILHADIRKRVTSALAASANIPQACDLLAAQAVSRKRLALIGGHALIVAAALLAWMLFPKARLTRLGQRSPLPLRKSPPAARHPGTVRTDAGHRQPHGRDRPRRGGIACVCPGTAARGRCGWRPLPWQPPHPCPPQTFLLQRVGTSSSPAPTEPASQASQPTRSRPTPRSAKPTAANNEKPTAPRPPARPAHAPPASALRPPASKTVFATKSAEPARPSQPQQPAPVEDFRPSARRPASTSTWACSPTKAMRAKAQSRLLNEGCPRFRQTLDGAKISACACGWGLCVAQPGEAPPPQSKRWDWKPWCSASSSTGKHRLTKFLFVNIELPPQGYCM